MNTNGVRKVIDRNVNLKAYTDARIHGFIDEQASEHYQFLLTYQVRGWCSAGRRIITIPQWVLSKPKGNGYTTWYVAHELAHAYDKCKHGHDEPFMMWLRKICPEEYQYWEFGYKFRNAKQAGVSVNGLTLKDLL